MSNNAFYTFFYILLAHCFMCPMSTQDHILYLYELQMFLNNNIDNLVCELLFCKPFLLELPPLCNFQHTHSAFHSWTNLFFVRRGEWVDHSEISVSILK